jgi:hypothetical protein
MQPVYNNKLQIMLSLLLIFAIITTGGGAALHVYTIPLTPVTAQLQFQDSIIVTTNVDPTPHLLKLKATQNGEEETVRISEFTVDTTNILSAPMNSYVVVFATDPLMSVLEAKVGLANGDLLNLAPASAGGQPNSFSLTNLPIGVYTLDIITQKGSQKGAYEGILAISNSANAPAPTQIQNQIKRASQDIDLIFSIRDTDSGLPECDGSFQDCRTESGQVCEAGTTEDGCELEGYHCIEDEGCGNFSDGICIDCDTDEESEEEEEETANCGGEPCTPTEKEDSTLDDETEYEDDGEIEGREGDGDEGGKDEESGGDEDNEDSGDDSFFG